MTMSGWSKTKRTAERIEETRTSRAQEPKMLWEWKATKPTANQPGTSNPLWEKTMPSRKASTNLGLELHPIGLFNSWHDYKIFKILQLFQDSRTQSEPQKIPARRNFTRKINGTSEAWRQRFWAPHRWFRRNFHWSNGQMVKWSNGQMVKWSNHNWWIWEPQPSNGPWKSLRSAPDLTSADASEKRFTSCRAVSWKTSPLGFLSVTEPGGGNPWSKANMENSTSACLHGFNQWFAGKNLQKTMVYPSIYE